MAHMIIVFAGPPLSGKTKLSKRLSRRRDIKRYSVDEIRRRELPHSDQTKRDRNVGYRVMHRKVARYLSRKPCGSSVIVDATYGPPEHRSALVELARSHETPICLIECRTSPNDAAQRFRARKGGHAAVDLTEARVREIAATFTHYGGGLSVDTSMHAKRDCLRMIEAHIDSQETLAMPDDWAADRALGERALIPISDRDADLIAPRSRLQAWGQLVAIGLFVVTALGFALFGFISLSGVVEEAPDPAEFFGAAGALLTVAAFFRFLSAPSMQRALNVVRAGSGPRFGPATEVKRSNRELVQDYLERVPPETRESLLARMPPTSDGLRDVPVVFLIEPQSDLSFDVRCALDGPRWSEKAIAKRAMEGPFRTFSWPEFARWQRALSRRDYYGWTRLGTRHLRITDVGRPVLGDGVSILRATGSPIRYEDYLVTEQSARLEIEGQLPYLREFFEGPRWNAREVDLTPEGFGREHSYSLMASVQAIITTKDDKVVLQRRSRHVHAAGGGIASSAGGSADWSDVQSRLRRVLSGRHERSWRHDRSLRVSLFREIGEELGLQPHDFEEDSAPFIAAALNLRYGRDLNFYAHLRYQRSSADFIARFERRRWWQLRAASRWAGINRGKDSWEVAHLVLLPIAEINPDGSLSPRGSEIVGSGRHVRGALCALARSGRL